MDIDVIRNLRDPITVIETKCYIARFIAQVLYNSTSSDSNYDTDAIYDLADKFIEDIKKLGGVR